MKTMTKILMATLLLVAGKVAAQTETAPECLNLEQVQQKIGYPEEAKRAGVAGKVVAQVTVDPSGKVEKAEVIESPGKALSDAVLAHIAELRFTPAKQNGKPIKSIVQVPIVFDAGGGAKVFTSLEEALTTTEVVEQLDLSGQKLNTLDPRVSRLKSLRVIDLGENQFTAIPSVLAKLPALEEINIGSNQLKAVPGWIKKVKSLRSLDISDNQIPAAEIERLRTALQDIELLTD